MTKIIYNNKKYKLSKDFKCGHILNLKFKLTGILDITNISDMFHGSCYLKSISNISKWNTSNVNDMSEMFYGCKSLILLPDISNWNTNNITNIRGMFSECNSLTSLPDISNWNTNKVTIMSYMFYLCFFINIITRYF